jgi:transcriptional regulator with XRE-family HTH domain
MNVAPKQSAPPLRAVREAQGLRLTDVARRAGISAGHLSRVERGQACLSVDALARLAGVLGLRDLTRFLKPYVPEVQPRADA